MFVALDLDKLAQQHQSGAYYLMQVVLACLKNLTNGNKASKALLANL